MINTKNYLAEFDQSERENKKNTVRLRKKLGSKSSRNKLDDDDQERLVQPMPVFTPEFLANIQQYQSQLPNKSNGYNLPFMVANPQQQVDEITETEPTSYNEIKKRNSSDYYENDESNV